MSLSQNCLKPQKSPKIYLFCLGENFKFFLIIFFIVQNSFLACSNLIYFLFYCSNYRFKRRLCLFQAKSRLSRTLGGCDFVKTKFLFSVFYPCIFLNDPRIRIPLLLKRAKSSKRTLVLRCNSAIKADPLGPVSSSPQGDLCCGLFFLSLKVAHA